MYRDDYARGGIRMLPVIEPDGESTARRIVLCSLLLIPISLLPVLLGMTGLVYAAAAVAAGLGFFTAACGWDESERHGAHTRSCSHRSFTCRHSSRSSCWTDLSLSKLVVVRFGCGDHGRHRRTLNLAWPAPVKITMNCDDPALVLHPWPSVRFDAIHPR